VNYGGYSGRNDEIDMMTRSMLQIMLEFAAVVQVPESDVAHGKATPGLVDAQAAGALSGPPLRVLVTDTPDAHRDARRGTDQHPQRRIPLPNLPRDPARIQPAQELHQARPRHLERAPVGVHSSPRVRAWAVPYVGPRPHARPAMTGARKPSSSRPFACCFRWSMCIRTRRKRPERPQCRMASRSRYWTGILQTCCGWRKRPSGYPLRSTSAKTGTVERPAQKTMLRSPAWCEIWPIPRAMRPIIIEAGLHANTASPVRDRASLSRLVSGSQ
jgi:hypothetical protein